MAIEVQNQTKNHLINVFLSFKSATKHKLDVVFINFNILNKKAKY